MKKEVIAFFIDIFKSLKPSTDDDPRLQYSWRQAVFYTLIVLMAFGVFSFAWAQGLVPHLPGVATSDDVDNVKRQINGLSRKSDVDALKQVVRQLNNQVYASNVQAADAAIVEKETIICRAINTNNSLASNFATQQLQIALANYHMLTGHDYFHIPTCQELGINVRQRSNGDYQQ